MKLRDDLSDVLAFIFGACLLAAYVVGILCGHWVTSAGYEREIAVLDAKLSAAQARVGELEGVVEAMGEEKAKERSVVLAWDAITSFYTEDSSGGTQADGRPFNEDALTGAHRTLRLGTIMLLENPANGRISPIQIQDRGPAKWTGRDLDVSLAVARQLGMVRAGEARLRCYMIVRPSGGDWDAPNNL